MNKKKSSKKLKSILKSKKRRINAYFTGGSYNEWNFLDFLNYNNEALPLQSRQMAHRAYINELFKIRDKVNELIKQFEVSENDEML